MILFWILKNNKNLNKKNKMMLIILSIQENPQSQDEKSPNFANASSLEQQQQQLSADPSSMTSTLHHAAELSGADHKHVRGQTEGRQQSGRMNPLHHQDPRITYKHKTDYRYDMVYANSCIFLYLLTGIKRDKAMADKLMYSPNNAKQNYHFCRLWLKRLNT